MRMSYRTIDLRSIRSWSASKIMMAVTLSTLVTAVYTTGCKSQISAKLVQGTKSSASLSGLKPITAKPGETVSLSGVGFKSSQKNVVKITTASGSVVTASATVLSDTAATFVMPTGAGLGLTSVVLESNGKQMTGAMSFVANLASNALAILIDDASEICSTKQYIDKNGDTKTGTKNCSSGSSDLTNLTAGNIKSGVTIAGVTGQYPSATYTLSGSSGADLTTATFDAQIKSSAIFQYFDSAGTRYAATGDADITAGNIANGVSVFGLSGTLTATAPNAWDVRVGTVVNGVTGKLKVNCRNRVRAALYNYDGAVGSIPNTGVATVSTNYDYWDTIDDYNNGVSGLPTDVVTGYAGWTTNNDCSGVEATADDANVWKDITTTGDGTTASTCAGTAAHCTMKDKITALQWSKMANFSFTNSTTTNTSATLVVSSTTGLVAGMVVSGTGIPANTYILSVVNGTNLTMSANATATASTVTVTVNTSRWNGAVAYCDGLNHNGATDWRIPTHKELMESYAHGVRSAASANWITEAQIDAIFFWSGSSWSGGTSLAWAVNVADGNTDGTFRSNGFQVVCVR
jgi:hypothetical protein